MALVVRLLKQSESEGNVFSMGTSFLGGVGWGRKGQNMTGV